MSFDSLKNLLPKTFQKKSGGVARQVESVLVVRQGNICIATMWGEVMTERAQAIAMKDGVLRIACLSAPVAAELRLREDELKNMLNAHFGKAVVRGIFTQL